MKQLSLVFFMTVLSFFSSKAEINFETSIQTHIVAADWIVDGTLKKISKVEIDGNFALKCSFVIDTVLKGAEEVPNSFQFYIDCFYADKLDFDELNSVIGFFELSNDSIFVRQDAWGEYPLLVDFNYFSDVYLFNAKGFSEVMSKGELVSIIKHVGIQTVRYLQNNSFSDIETIGLEIPYESTIFGYLYGGSSCFLYVPDFLFPHLSKDF
ncbi:MAG: hypothetical protein ACPG4Z_07925 [Chitinophagales bacterium]